ncbi:MAG: hypothetical protein KGQ75_14820 [Sphingomonadales bacterium]|nr:hypothetical protein [Sphingomonadales bacterium]
MALDAPPAAVTTPAPLPSRNIMIWGSQRAMDALRAAFEGKEWRWAVGSLGGKTPMVVLIPPASIPDAEISQVLTDINAGKFGQISGGFATFDVPGSSPQAAAS